MPTTRQWVGPGARRRPARAGSDEDAGDLPRTGGARRTPDRGGGQTRSRDAGRPSPVGRLSPRLGGGFTWNILLERLDLVPAAGEYESLEACRTEETIMRGRRRGRNRSSPQDPPDPATASGDRTSGYRCGDPDTEPPVPACCVAWPIQRTSPVDHLGGGHSRIPTLELLRNAPPPGGSRRPSRRWPRPTPSWTTSSAPSARWPAARCERGRRGLSGSATPRWTPRATGRRPTDPGGRRRSRKHHSPARRRRVVATPSPKLLPSTPESRPTGAGRGPTLGIRPLPSGPTRLP